MYYYSTQKKFDVYYDRELMDSLEQQCEDLLFFMKVGDFYSQEQTERLEDFMNTSRHHRMAACLYISRHAPYNSDLMPMARKTLAGDLDYICRTGETLASYFLQRVLDSMDHRPKIRAEFGKAAYKGYYSLQGRLHRFINHCMLRMS